ncbi:MAG: ParB/RepB/Spo0J family partition protein [Oscillospiraceae bacterium]|nr:ParB/RepB/Spo0J family partition protein [Oscillospiraceae bacterium]
MVSQQGRRRIVEIPLDRIQPNPAQPRQNFNQKELDSLSESIQQNGLLQPILVRQKDFGYELIAGERRLRACRIAGLTTVPCIVNECDAQNAAIYAMLENLQRQDLKLFEEAEGLQKLIAQWGITQEEAAKRLGKSQSAIANKMRLLKLTEEERQKITDASLSGRHARALIRIGDESLRKKVLDEVIAKGLNVSQTERLVDKTLEQETDFTKEKRQHKTVVWKDYRIFWNTVQNAVSLMQKSGINAVTDQKETDEFYEMTVRIPKVQKV